MRDPGLLVILLATGAGLVLGPQRWKATLAGASGSILAMLATSAFAIGPPADIVWSAAWAVVAAMAMATWLPRLGAALPVVLACAAGAVGGGLSAAVSNLLLFLAILALSTVMTAGVAGRGWALAPKVVAGWLLAVAALNATLAVLPVTPGYLPDHME
jgi:hypothetical protein